MLSGRREDRALSLADAPTVRLRGLILDSLLPEIDAEVATALRHDAILSRWTGSDEDLAEADFVLHVRTIVDAEMIDRLTRCVAIGRFGTGLDTVDEVTAAERGITVVRVADYATHEVAQHAVALALGVARGLESFSRIHPRDAWPHLSSTPHLGIRGPIGIVGFGQIGRRVAALFRGLDLEVRVATRDGVALFGSGLVHQHLDELVAECEVVSLHTALVPETRHLMSRERLRRMRSDAILVNTGRGPLVDSRALVEALTEGVIRGAGLDVYEADGDVDWWEVFRGLPVNVLLTPHIAWYSPDSLARLRAEAVRRTVEAARRSPPRREAERPSDSGQPALG